MNNNQKLGNYGENLIAHNLSNNGFSILARQYKKRSGEIDLIARKDNLLAFVEVKTRRKACFDLASLITHTKQQKIINVAQLFMAEYQHEDMACRFDVALIEMEYSKPKITYLAGAF